MRIYIEDIDPKKITREKLSSLENFYSSKKDIFEIFSEKGMYLVESFKIWKLQVTNEKVVKVIDGCTTFTIDESNIYRQPCTQIPFDHVCIETTNFIYSSKNVRLIVEGHYVENISAKINIDKSDKYCNYIPSNFYFEKKNNNLKISDPFIKNEINGFLSLLN